MKRSADFSSWIMNDISQWGVLAQNGYLVRVKGNNVLFNQGEMNSYVYIVKSGRVSLSYFTSDGKEQIFMFVLAGGIFGETTCFGLSAQCFHATTIVNCELYRIPMDEFLNHLSYDVALNSCVHESLARKVHILAQQMVRLSFLDAESHIAAVFVDLASEFGEENTDSIKINLPVTQQGFADLVNTSRVTVGKVIRKFEKNGYIKKKANRYYIYNLDELRRLSVIH